jgi:zinc protease
MESGENNPTQMLWQKMSAAAYQWHSYGKSTIGARADVENVNIEHLQAFYRQFYQPDNAVLIVTGKFDQAKTLARIGQYFGALAKPTRTLEPMWTVEPVQDGPRSVSLERVGEAPIVAALYHVPQGSAEDFPAVQVLDEILTNTPNGRLYKALVKAKLAASVGGTAMALHDPGYEVILANLEKTQSPDKAAKVMLEVIENVKKTPITEEEVARAKRVYDNFYENIMDDPAQFGVHLSESIAVGDWRTLFLDRDRIASVTVADVQRVAEAYFKDSNRTAGRFIPTAAPDRAPLPPAVDVDKLVADYKGKEALAAGEEFDPSPANIEARTKRFNLPNGMKVAELMKKTRGDTVAGHLTLRFGDLATLYGKRVTPFLTGQLLNRGAGKLTRQQIADRFEALKATVRVSSSVDSATVTFETKREKLGDVLDLIALILRHPTFPDGEAEELKTEWQTGIENSRHEPSAVASNALTRHGNPYPRDDIRYARSFDDYAEDDKAVTVAEAKAFHAAFYGADHAEMALVGDFDPAVVDPQLVRLFGDWKSKKPYARIPYPFVDKQPIAEQIETPDKANGFYTARLSIPLIEDDPAVIPLTLGNRILGGGGLKSRLVDRLRQKDGISYGAGSGFSANSFDANSSFSMNAIYAPQNLGKLKTGVSEVLTTILKDGVTEEELSEAKSGLLQSWLINRAQDSSLAGQLAFQLYAGRTMDYVQSREETVRATTVEQVNDALRRYIRPAKLEQFYAGDFAGAAKKEADTAGH